MRKSELRRKAGLKQKRGRPKEATLSRQRDRRNKEWARAYGSLSRVLAVKSMTCCVPGCGEFAENAHIEGSGTGRKADADKIARLCRGHHRTRTDSLHNLGSKEAFQRVHGVDLDAEAAEVERLLPTKGG